MKNPNWNGIAIGTVRQLALIVILSYAWLVAGLILWGLL